MPGSADSVPAERPHGARAGVLALIFVGTALHAAIAVQSPAWREGGLADTDSYVRLLRVLELWGGGGWLNGVLPWLDPPAGLAMHWTRPLDALVIGFAWPAILVGVAPEAALYWSVALICPALHIAASLVAVWAARALWPPDWCWFAGLILISNPAAVAYSSFGRADHHTLVLLCIVVGLGFAARAAAGRIAAAIPAGLAFGAGIWVAPEALFTAVPALAALGLLWCAGMAVAAAVGARIAAGMALAIVVAMAVERPLAEFWTVEQDRVSIQHLTLAATIGVVFASLGQLSRTLHAPFRFAAGIAVATAGGAALLLAWPDLLHGPTAAAQGEGARAFLKGVQELQPLRFGTRNEALTAIGLAGGAIAAFLALGIATLVRALVPGWRAAAWVIAVTTLSCAAAAMTAQRFALNLAAPAAIAAAGLVPLAVVQASRFGAMARLTALLGAAFVVLLLPYASAAAMKRMPGERAAVCDVNAIARGLAELSMQTGTTSPAPVLIADDINQGPAAAYVARLRALTGPYHRLGAGFTETRVFFDAVEDNTPEAIAQRRDVALVLVCRHAAPLGPPWRPDGLRTRLLAGTPPAWLIERDLPQNLRDAGFRLYERR